MSIRMSSGAAKVLLPQFSLPLRAPYVLENFVTKILEFLCPWRQRLSFWLGELLIDLNASKCAKCAKPELLPSLQLIVFKSNQS